MCHSVDNGIHKACEGEARNWGDRVVPWLLLADPGGQMSWNMHGEGPMQGEARGSTPPEVNKGED